MRVRIVCRTCGGCNVKRDAWAEWDEVKQKWVSGDVYDNAWCDDCGNDVNLDEVEIVTLTVTREMANTISRALHEAAALRAEEVTDGGHDAEQTQINEETAADYEKAAEAFDAATGGTP